MRVRELSYMLIMMEEMGIKVEIEFHGRGERTFLITSPNTVQYKVTVKKGNILKPVRVE